MRPARLTQTRSTRSPRPREIACAITFGLLVGLPAAGAHAAPPGAQVTSASDAVAAEALFSEARRLMMNGQYAEACPKLEESQRLDAGMGTLFNLADCYERAGRSASAWATFLNVAAQASAAGQDARAADARARAKALEPGLPKLTINVAKDADVRGLAVTRDGIAVGRAQWNLAVPVDPGPHTVVATAPGYPPFEGRIDARPNASGAIVSVPAFSGAAVSEPPADPAAPAEERGRSRRIAAFVLGGVGVVGLGVGAVFGVTSLGKRSSAGEHCDAENLCDAQGVALRDDAIRAGTISTVAVVAGAVALAGGAVLYFTAPRAGSGSARIHVQALPAVTPSAASVSLRATF